MPVSVPILLEPERPLSGREANRDVGERNYWYSCPTEEGYTYLRSCVPMLKAKMLSLWDGVRRGPMFNFRWKTEPQDALENGWWKTVVVWEHEERWGMNHKGYTPSVRKFPNSGRQYTQLGYAGTDGICWFSIWLWGDCINGGEILVLS